MKIIGVDFSGASTDKDTWLCNAQLDGDVLPLSSCASVKRKRLTEILRAIDEPIVGAMDFPFAVPQAFANFWQPRARTIPDLWEASADLELSEFRKWRDAFVAEHEWDYPNGEPKRNGDMHHPGCFSPLHAVRPDMIPMTFYGMQMLHELWPLSYRIPPLSIGYGTYPYTESTLLEVMPGAVLKHLRLPSKGYKRGADALVLRECIWEGLPTRSLLELKVDVGLKAKALENDNCLDAIVAAVAAALWHRDEGSFRCQPDEDDVVAKLEGWLYSLDCDKPHLHTSSNG